MATGFVNVPGASAEAYIIQAVPTQAGLLEYNGKAQSPMWNNYDSAKLTLAVTAQTNAGNYTATFTPINPYVWSDKTSDAKTVSWSIGKATIGTTPSQNGTLTYNGSEQTATWSNYDSAKLSIGGTLKATTAGDYTATFTPKANYKWSDNTTAAKNVSWKIEKSNSSFTLSKNSVSLNAATMSATVTVAKSGTTGAVTASSNATGIATVSVSGTTLTITAVKSGSATITVSVAGDTNYNAPSNKTISVTVELASATLSENTPAQIKAIAQSGQAGNYWKAGDSMNIAVKGTVGSLSINGTYKATILGINHNQSVEGNGVHFIIGKDSSGKDIAFCDSSYNSSGSSAAFRMNTTNTNSGGWNGSYMRKTICPAFLAALPTEWQNAISACTKYSDNTGGGSDTASYVTSTSDKIWLLSEFEVQGARTYANSAEKNKQAQYDYYKNGNSKVRYRHDANTTAVHWWLRSVYCNASDAFCCVRTSGSAYYGSAYFSYGFAPAFKL